jgi:ankyrin repeat protein
MNGAVLNVHAFMVVLQGGGTPLHWAAHCGNMEIVERLLGAGALVNAFPQVIPLPGSLQNGAYSCCEIPIADTGPAPILEGDER